MIIADKKGNYYIGRLRSLATISRPIVSHRDTILPANLPDPPLSKHFAPAWEFSVNFEEYGRRFSFSAGLQRFQTLDSNVKPKRPPSILFLGLLDTSKIRSISFTPVACITSDIFSVFLVQAREVKLEASEESQTQKKGRRFSLALHSPSLAWKTRKK